MDGTQVRNLLLFSTVFAVVGSAVFGPALTAVLLFVFGGGAFGYRPSIGSPS